MATKYYSDGTYTKGDGKLYYPGLGVVGKDKNTTVSKSESGTSKPTSTSSTSTKSNSTNSSSKNTSNKSNSSSSSFVDPDAGLTMSEYYAKYGVDPNERYSNSSSTPSKNVVDVEEEDPYEAYRETLKEQYAEQQRLIEEQNRLAVQQGVNRLEAQKYNVNQSADENARQAYIQNMQAKKALPQQLASQGITGGATETANLGLAATYQNNLNAINQNRANAIQDIDNAITDLRNTGNLEAVGQVLANNQQALDAYQNAFAQQQSYNQWATQYNANRADTEYERNQAAIQYANQLEQQKLENQWYKDSYSDSQKQNETNRIINLLENGLVDVNYASSMLGVPVSQLNDYVNYINGVRNLEAQQAQAELAYKQSQTVKNLKGSTGSDKGNQTYSQVLSGVQKLNTSAGADYNDNLAAARYALNSDLAMSDVISIMKQTNVRPEAFVREMVNEGYSEEDVMNFIESYTPNQEYRDSLFNYAYPQGG